MGRFDDEIEGFLHGVSASRGLWNALDFRVVAARVDDRWHNLVSRCTLESRHPSEVLRLLHLPRTDHVVAQQYVGSANELEKLIGQVRSGSVVVNGYTIHYLSRRDGEVFSIPYNDAGYSCTNIMFDESPTTFSSGHRLTIRGDNAGEVLHRLPGGSSFLDSILRQLDRPWDGMNAVTLHAGGIREVIDITSTRRVEFIAPVEATFDLQRTRLRAGELGYTVIVGSRAVRERCTLGVFGILKTGQIVSESIPLSRRRWRVHPSGYSYAGVQRFRNVQQLTLILRIGSFDLPTVRLVNEPPGLPPLAAAYAAADPDLARFRQLLFTQDGSKAREFERAVARLFRFAGFIADDLMDNPRGSDALDGLAFEPKSRILLSIECTTGAIDQDGKLAKLYKRANAVRANLSSEIGVEVIPIIVTFLGMDELLESERTIATDHGIHIISREGLEYLYELVISHSPVEKIVELFHTSPESIWRNFHSNPLAD
jgi:hypothetical protein